MDQALARWPGVRQIDSFSGTLQHGRTPNVFRLTIAPQLPPVSGVGTLELIYGRTRIRFPGCCVDSASYQFNEGGYLVGLHILDRRWQWRYPVISGAYNQTDDAGNIIDAANGVASPIINSKRRPQDLARLLLKAMGEQGADVSELPNDVFPKVTWSVTNAGLALADLCEQLGCRIVLGLDNKVRIKKVGVGKTLPNLPFIDAQMEIDPAERPSALRLHTAPVLFQTDFELDAVGLDTDNSIKPIDELSYKPSAGWGAGDSRYFSGVSNLEHRRLASLSVFRWYRIRNVLRKLHVPVTEQAFDVVDNRQIVLDSQQVETDTEGDRKRRRSAWVFGVFFPGHFSNGASALVTASDGNTASAVSPITSNKDVQFCPVAFEIDGDNKMVRFGEPVYRLVSGGTLGAAILRLRTGFRLLEWATGDPVRVAQQRDVKNATAKTAPLAIVRTEIEPTVRMKFKAAYAPNGSADNGQAVAAQIKYYLDSELASLGIDDPSAKKYFGLLAQELDGALQSISWEIGIGGAFTTIQRNQDRPPRGAIPYELRRQGEKERFRANMAETVGDLIGAAVKQAAKLRPRGGAK